MQLDDAPEDLVLIERSPAWKNNTALAHVFTIGTTEQRDVGKPAEPGGHVLPAYKILPVRGEKKSPHEAYSMAKHHGDKDAAFEYVKYLFKQNAKTVQKLREDYNGCHPRPLSQRCSKAGPTGRSRGRTTASSLSRKPRQAGPARKNWNASSGRRISKARSKAAPTTLFSMTMAATSLPPPP